MLTKAAARVPSRATSTNGRVSPNTVSCLHKYASPPTYQRGVALAWKLKRVERIVQLVLDRDEKTKDGGHDGRNVIRAPSRPVSLIAAHVRWSKQRRVQEPDDLNGKRNKCAKRNRIGTLEKHGRTRRDKERIMYPPPSLQHLCEDACCWPRRVRPRRPHACALPTAPAQHTHRACNNKYTAVVTRQRVARVAFSSLSLYFHSQAWSHLVRVARSSWCGVVARHAHVLECDERLGKRLEAGNIVEHNFLPCSDVAQVDRRTAQHTKRMIHPLETHVALLFLNLNAKLSDGFHESGRF